MKKNNNDNSERTIVTRRQFLHSVGATAGTPMLYRTMGALGFLAGCSDYDRADQASQQGYSRQALSPTLGNGKSVLVLGAGIGGLTAAYELSLLGYQVKILEATKRAGGRNMTVRNGDVLTEEGHTQTCRFDNDDHLYMNLGPARIPYHHEKLLTYCREFGVELEVFTNDNRAAFFHSRDTNTNFVARRLQTDIRGHIVDLLAKAVNKGALDQELTTIDREAFLDMLSNFGALNTDRQYVGSSQAGFRDRVHPGLQDPKELALAEVTPLSVIVGNEVLRDYRSVFQYGMHQHPTLLQPVGGMDQIVRGFLMHVGRFIQHDSIVTRIESTDAGGQQGSPGVVITLRDATQQTRQERADFAICTIPSPVLRDIDANFRAAVKSEIRSMQYVNAVKIGAQAKRRFWEEDYRIYGGISWTDQEATQVWYPASGYHRRKGILLLAYTWDDDTDSFFSALSPADRLSRASQQLDNLHRGASKELEFGISRAWGKVPFQKGSWAKDEPDFQKHAELSLGDGQVYFAGEHVSYLHGWQEGAVLSAQAAVQAIAARTTGRGGGRAPSP